jgi:3'(2'), 5'-bisphosphate nucleotidase
VTLKSSGFKHFALAAVAVAQRAGAAIMDIYRTAPDVRYKDDRSPVTDADHAAENIIVEALAKLMPGVPVIAEERAAAGQIPLTGSEFFLVDPLDGTKEFLKRNGEFTVNIALVRDESPVFGLIFAPDLRDCYITLEPGQAFRCKLAPAHEPVAEPDFLPLTGEAPAERPLTAITSRSHLGPETLAFLEKLGRPPRLGAGSSLKFGALAAGEADVYPRFGPTCEWDIAAGQAILEAAGGCVLTVDGTPLRYGKRAAKYLNPSFIAWRRPDIARAA